MKPHYRRVGDTWHCSFKGVSSQSDNPYVAFIHACLEYYHQNGVLPRQKFRYVLITKTVKALSRSGPINIKIDIRKPEKFTFFHDLDFSIPPFYL